MAGGSARPAGGSGRAGISRVALAPPPVSRPSISKRPQRPIGIRTSITNTADSKNYLQLNSAVKLLLVPRKIIDFSAIKRLDVVPPPAKKQVRLALLRVEPLHTQQNSQNLQILETASEEKIKDAAVNLFLGKQI